MRWLALALVAACGGHPVDPVPVAPVAAPVATGPSVYDLPLALTAADGTAIALDVDRGHTTLISMFYGTCPAACPMLVEAIGRALDQAPPDVRVLLVSFDPVRDTPAALRDIARRRHLDGRWTLAAAADLDARTLAAVLGIRYRATANGQFFHTSAIVALDADGRMLGRMDGLGDPAPLVAALR